MKTVWYRHKNRYIDKWKRIRSPKISPCIYVQPLFDEAAKNTQWGNDILFNKWCWENWISTTCKRMKSDPYLTPLRKINSKWNKDLNVRPETVKLLKENRGEKLFNISLDND